MKRCTHCKLDLPFSSFNKNRTKADGLQEACRECRRAYKAENRERIREQRHQYYEANRELLILQMKKYHAEHREENKRNCKAYYQRTFDAGKLWGRNLRGRYGITEQEYTAMYEAQAGKCAICEQAALFAKDLHVDHDHVTGKVRALLCRKCNLLIGYAGESPDILLAAVAYLAKWSESVA